MKEIEKSIGELNGLIHSLCVVRDRMNQSIKIDSLLLLDDVFIQLENKALKKIAELQRVIINVIK